MFRAQEIVVIVGLYDDFLLWYNSYMEAKQREIVEKLMIYGRPEILKDFRADSCIVSTAIGIDVLTAFGILAEPLPIKTSIFNTPYVKRIESGSEFPNRETLIRWGQEDGSYSVGIGYGENQPNKWAGHLVILAENQWLIDLSIDQANRPAYNMVFAPIAVEIDDSFLKGKTPRIVKQDDCVIRMEAIGDRGFLISPDWTFKSRRSFLVAKIVQKIKESK